MMRTFQMRLVAISLVSALGFFACAEDIGSTDVLGDDGKPESAATEDGKEDRWNYANRPELFDGEFVYTLADLPREGRAERDAWPSSYWPTYEGSIGVRWNDDVDDEDVTDWDRLSPAEKYDVAYNGWVPPENFFELRPYNPSTCRTATEDNPDRGWDDEYYDVIGPFASYVARYVGPWDSHDGVDSDDDDEIDECDDRDGVATWFGLCHAWVPAAMLEDNPQRTVAANDVNFYVGDLEALLIAAYNRSPAQMIGGRCNEGHDDEHVIERDEFGRPELNQCSDTNAGTFHIIMANYLGLQSQPVAEDRTWDYEVWNQPVVGFNVTSLEEVTLERAHELLNVPAEETPEGETPEPVTYEFNDGAVTFFEVRANTTYVTEGHPSKHALNPSSYERHDYYHYLLELDGDGKIVGGEWIGSSRTNHPDFLWNPRRNSRSSMSYLDLDVIRDLVAQSRLPENPISNPQEFAAQPNLEIPDNTPAGIVSTIDVDEALTIAGLQLTLDISHSYRGDLRVVLTHNGTEYVAHNRTGGREDDLNTTITIPAFNGASATGTWTLSVSDHANLDEGTLKSWSLRFNPEADGGNGNGRNESFSAAPSMAIPDNNAGGITSEVVVPNDITAGTVSVALRITHTWRGDLLVKVEHDGRTWPLHDQQGGSDDNLELNVPLEGFTGSPAGTWNLHVSDHAGYDEGTLESWSVNVTVPE